MPVGNIVSGGKKEQTDWTESDTTKSSYLKNKPTKVSAFTNDVNYLTKAGKGYTCILPIDGWEGNVYTANVPGILETDDIIVSPDPTCYEDYNEAGIYCSSFAADGQLNFTRTKENETELTVNILKINSEHIS